MSTQYKKALEAVDCVEAQLPDLKVRSSWIFSRPGLLADGTEHLPGRGFK